MQKHQYHEGSYKFMYEYNKKRDWLDHVMI